MPKPPTVAPLSPPNWNGEAVLCASLQTHSCMVGELADGGSATGGGDIITSSNVPPATVQGYLR